MGSGGAEREEKEKSKGWMSRIKKEREGGNEFRSKEKRERKRRIRKL